MLATKANPRSQNHHEPQRCVLPLPTDDQLGLSPIVLGRPTRLVDSMLAEFHHHGISAGHAGAVRVPPLDEDPPAVRPATGYRDGTGAVIVVLDSSMVGFLFGELGGSRASMRLLARARRAGACENQVCDTATEVATAVAARRLLIVCDARQASTAERTRAIRWIRRAAHRIAYECSMNGLPGLGTSYTVAVADTTDSQVARSVVDWHRGAPVR